MSASARGQREGQCAAGTGCLWPSTRGSYGNRCAGQSVSDGNAPRRLGNVLNQMSQCLAISHAFADRRPIRCTQRCPRRDRFSVRRCAVRSLDSGDGDARRTRTWVRPRRTSVPWHLVPDPETPRLHRRFRVAAPGRAIDDGDVRQQQGSEAWTTPNRKGRRTPRHGPSTC